MRKKLKSKFIRPFHSCYRLKKANKDKNSEIDSLKERVKTLEDKNERLTERVKDQNDKISE